MRRSKSWKRRSEWIRIQFINLGDTLVESSHRRSQPCVAVERKSANTWIEFTRSAEFFLRPGPVPIVAELRPGENFETGDPIEK